MILCNDVVFSLKMYHSEYFSVSSMVLIFLIKSVRPIHTSGSGRNLSVRTKRCLWTGTTLHTYFSVVMDVTLSGDGPADGRNEGFLSVFTAGSEWALSPQGSLWDWAEETLLFKAI